MPYSWVIGTCVRLKEGGTLAAIDRAGLLAVIDLGVRTLNIGHFFILKFSDMGRQVCGIAMYNNCTAFGDDCMK